MDVHARFEWMEVCGEKTNHYIVFVRDQTDGEIVASEHTHRSESVVLKLKGRTYICFGPDSELGGLVFRLEEVPLTLGMNAVKERGDQKEGETC